MRITRNNLKEAMASDLYVDDVEHNQEGKWEGCPVMKIPFLYQRFWSDSLKFIVFEECQMR